jgi:hypothetical protein
MDPRGGLELAKWHGYKRRSNPCKRYLSPPSEPPIVLTKGSSAQIGYYHICGVDASVLPGTDFQDHYDVFAGAWSRLTRGIEEASKRGIGVLIG